VLKAREGRLTMDDLSGGTFTVNNTGALGSIASGPIINQPQAGIITMEAIVKRPIVTEDDAIAIRSMMNSCLAFDHRVTDGAEALRFLRSVKQRVEAFGSGTTIY
jgi:2-oxoisovalerate dehydrogenase E2 component (dihydrolipoyl transacylase)